MKNNSSIYLLVFLLIAVSCNSNRLKTDEKSLVKQILTEEEQRAHEEQLRIEREQQLADSIAKLPKGFRFKEERGVDPEHPPMVIDIAGSLDSIRPFKLSDVATEVKYIRMEALPDSTLPNDMKFKYYLMDNYLVAANLYGIHLYSKQGEFIRSVVKNELTGVNVDLPKDRIHFWNDYTLVGGGTSVWGRGDDLFYTYSNNITGQRYIMEYNCAAASLMIENQPGSENTDSIIGLGTVSVDLRHGDTRTPPARKHQGMFSMSPDYLYKGMGVFSPDRNTYVQNMHGKNMLGILGTGGDTLATFAKVEQLENYTKNLMRGTDRGTQYEKDGKLFVRTNFNDTIFQVIPPNKLFPVYVFHLGEYKVTMQEGVDPGFDLNGKIILQDFADTRDYLFITFTKDSYDCPNNRRNKTLKLYRAIYSKAKHKLAIVEGLPTDYEAPILENDLDGGVPVWPQSFMVGRNGEILVSLKGSELKAHIKATGFENSTAPIEKKNELRNFANMLAADDNVLMIVK
ncbi:DUF4933 domain-containing protein [Maribellus sediminis]|uniref:DUF4933 domain-containing protein n=1 Tax=Maribellus sediminis TaxID=2696285 RepID=UPI00142F76E9|nr:DUF4933 domain-containing protein [Maribellus sediminis]